MVRVIEGILHILLSGAIIAAAVVVIVTAIASPAGAQELTDCGLYQNVVMHLDLKYQEKVIGRGLVNGKVLEVLASESGSWTVLVVHSNGLACHWASGTDWEIISSIMGDRV